MGLNIAFLTAFVLVSAANVIAVHKESRIGVGVTKPLLMPLLALVYAFTVPLPDIRVIAALGFGFLGDVLLMGSSKLMFTAGTLSFFCGHIFYILYFLGAVPFAAVSPLFYLLLLPYAAYGVFLFRRLLPHLGSDKIQAALYISCISLMSFSSLMRIWSVQGLGFLLTFTGSLLFITSDSILSLATYKGMAKGSDDAVMITYILAQALIIGGLMV